MPKLMPIPRVRHMREIIPTSRRTNNCGGLMFTSGPDVRNGHASNSNMKHTHCKQALPPPPPPSFDLVITSCPCCCCMVLASTARGRHLLGPWRMFCFKWNPIPMRDVPLGPVANCGGMHTSQPDAGGKGDLALAHLMHKSRCATYALPRPFEVIVRGTAGSIPRTKAKHRKEASKIKDIKHRYACNTKLQKIANNLIFENYNINYLQNGIV